MGRGRKPKPTEVKSRAEVRHTDRTRADQHYEDSHAPGIPDGLEPEERFLWAQIVNDTPGGVLRRLDASMMLEMMTVHAALRKLRPTFLANPNDKTTRCNYVDLQRQMERFSNLFGLSPTARASLRVPEGELDKESPKDAILRKFTG